MVALTGSSATTLRRRLRLLLGFLVLAATIGIVFAAVVGSEEDPDIRLEILPTRQTREWVVPIGPTRPDPDRAATLPGQPNMADLLPRAEGIDDGHNLQARSRPASTPIPLSTTDSPMFSKRFEPESVGEGDHSVLTFVVDNTGSDEPATNLHFADEIPPGIEVAAFPNAFTSCLGGDLSADGGGRLVAYHDGMVEAGQVCTVTVDISAVDADDDYRMHGPLFSSLGLSPAHSDTLVVSPRPSPR